MNERLQEGSEIICPLCESETVVVARNKKQRPFIFCRQQMVPMNFNSPISVSEEFLRQFIPEQKRDGSLNESEDAPRTTEEEFNALFED